MKRLEGKSVAAFQVEYIEIARTLAGSGATEVEVAAAFHVSPSTVRQWMALHPEFAAALALGEGADARVERVLFEHAVGYDYVVERIVESPDGVRFLVRRRCRQKADLGAVKLWLKKRRPQQWGDHQTTHSDVKLIVDKADQMA